MDIQNSLTFLLTKWFKNSQRQLSWRTTPRDPYITWICEVMSQQTSLEVVQRQLPVFLKTFPNIKSLSESSESDLRKVWSGLGYYARARNLQKGAQYIESLGSFPTTYDEIIKIPGCGPYTAGMVASLCFHEVIFARDGNVNRVLCRLLGKESPENVAPLFNQFILNLMTNPQFSPGEINESLIELGALICKKSSPLCLQCPWNNNCVSFKEDKIHLYPLKKKKPLWKQVSLKANIYYQNQEFGLILRKDSFLKNTLGFHLSETDLGENTDFIKHTITNHKIRCKGYIVNDIKEFSLDKIYWFPKELIPHNLSTSLDLKIWKSLEI
jgi:A/G-specific adenine glycosylase